MDYLGVQILENPYLTESRTHVWEVPRTFRERWVLPVLHPVTVPFEPWVRIRLEELTQTVPSEKCIVTSMGIFVHPAMMNKLRQALAAGNITKERRVL